MSRSRTCERGHRWESDDPDDQVCPVCATPQDSLDDAHATTQTPESFDELPPPPTSVPGRPVGSLPGITGFGTAAREQSATRRPPTIPGYEIVGELGRGGMGVVYRAWQRALNRPVALKVVLAGTHADPWELGRFHAEAEAVARLDHPNIVQIYEVGEHEGLPYLALELLDGGSLAQHLACKPLSPRTAAELAETLARAVHYAHQRGVVHRDLKPANILLVGGEQWAVGSKEVNPVLPTAHCPLPTAKIVDFGLAKRLDSVGATHTGQVLGTPSYMAPEQAAGRVRDIGVPTDVYALGAMLYEMLTGRPPFRGATAPETMLLLLYDEPVPVARLQPKVPRDLQTICLKCLRKEPDRRYASAADLADELRRFLAGEPVLARPIGLMERGWKWANRSRAQATLVVGALIVLTGAALAWIGYERQRRADLAAAYHREQEARAVARVEGLATADTTVVDRLVAEMAPLAEWTEPRLMALVASVPVARKEGLHARLALLATRPALSGELIGYLSHCRPDELVTLRDALRPHAKAAATYLWPILLDERAESGQRLRAASALASYTPDGRGWPKVSAAVVEQLVDEGPLRAAEWAKALWPVRLHLLGPLTAASVRRRYEFERGLAANLLADYAADQPDTLGELLLTADAHAFALYLAKAKNYPEVVSARMRAELAGDAAVTDAASARRRAAAAITLAHFGQPAAIWPLLRHSPDPTARSYLVHWLAERRLDPQVLLSRWQTEPDVSVRRAILLALGDYDERLLPQESRRDLAAPLVERYRTDPDAGTHGAIGWLLRYCWGRAEELDAIDRELAGRPPRPVPDVPASWFVGAHGQTFTLVRGPVEFMMGSPKSEPDREQEEILHRKRIDRSYAIANRPVTVDEWRRFLLANPSIKSRDVNVERFSPDGDGPIIDIDWYEAAAYCRWLSELEHVPPEQMCYPEVKAIKEGVRLPANHLERTGYRLPTEAEWEYACRAGAATSRFYGSANDLLGHYSWFAGNSDDRAWPVARKKPNDFGLFDMHGNVWNWCQSVRVVYPEDGGVSPDRETLSPVDEKARLVLRGGAFHRLPSRIRCAHRQFNGPGARNEYMGLRLVRTYPF
jgi:formylglycine-generating enzyme required for sulfatase activity